MGKRIKHNWIDLRISLLYWIDSRLFNTPPGIIPNRFMGILYNILFPFNWWYARQSQVRREKYSLHYVFDGIRFSHYFLMELKHGAIQGKYYSFKIDDNGTCSISGGLRVNLFQTVRWLMRETNLAVRDSTAINATQCCG